MTWNPIKRAISKAVMAERAACAQLCEEVVTFPAGHGGRWEGYGPSKGTRDGKELAALILARPSPSSGDEVQ